MAARSAKRERQGNSIVQGQPAAERTAMQVLQSEVGTTSFSALVGLGPLGKQIVQVQQVEGRKSTQVVWTDATKAASRAGNEQRAQQSWGWRQLASGEDWSRQRPVARKSCQREAPAHVQAAWLRLAPPTETQWSASAPLKVGPQRQWKLPSRSRTLPPQTATAARSRRVGRPQHIQ